MKIGIDARFWSQTGVGRYIRNIVDELAKTDSNNEYVIFLLPDDFETVNLPSNFKKVKTDIRWHTLAEQTKLPALYKKEHLDLLFVPNFNVPIFYPGPFVTTIHDLTLLRTRTGQVTRLPYYMFIIKYLASALIHLVSVKRAKRIFTVSTYVKDDLVRTFKISPEKIVLTPNAVGDNFYRRSSPEVGAVLNKYGIQKPYLFYVGNGCPHKNLDRLVEAFRKISGESPNLSLVLGGKLDFNYEKLRQKCETLEIYNRVKFTGFIDDKDLPAVYSGAEAYVSPSMYEGFGIQTLEAYACGCKVACSNTTSLPEVGGDLAYYFNPYDVENVALALKKVLKDTPDNFIYRAAAHVRKYSWAESAKNVHGSFLI